MVDFLHIIAYIAILIFVINIVIPIFISIYSYFIRDGSNVKKLGSWAVITGATDGIGKAFAFELAKKGMNIFLISRTQSRLSDVESELKSKYSSILVKTFELDFSSFDDELYYKLQEKLEPLDIGILVNNVGQSYAHPQFFDALELEEVRSLIALNVESTTLMTHMIIPKMRKAKKGAIYNISSFAALVPNPMLAAYSASKAYINSFTKALAFEFPFLTITADCPLYITSKLSKVRKSSIFTPSPSTYVKSALKTLGAHYVNVSYLPHAIAWWLIGFLPDNVIAVNVLGQHKALWSRAMRKKEQLSEKKE